MITTSHMFKLVESHLPVEQRQPKARFDLLLEIDNNPAAITNQTVVPDSR
ncbi:MAG: hypothetical protein R3C11_22745 [Planctomycetaceae bacterium]